MVVAHAFGAGPVTDAFLVAFRIPNLLRRLLGEGALSTAVIPVFTETLTRGGPTAFGRLARAATGAAIVVLCLVSALGVLLSHQVVAIMAPGWRADTGLFDLAGDADPGDVPVSRCWSGWPRWRWARSTPITASSPPPSATAVLNVAMIAAGARARRPHEPAGHGRWRWACWWAVSDSSSSSSRSCGGSGCR